MLISFPYQLYPLYDSFHNLKHCDIAFQTIGNPCPFLYPQIENQISSLCHTPDRHPYNHSHKPVIRKTLQIHTPSHQSILLCVPRFAVVQRDRYRLKVRASDRGVPPTYADVDVELDVVDRNNKPPIWDKSIYGPIHIRENVTVGTVVTSIKARLVFNFWRCSLIPRGKPKSDIGFRTLFRIRVGASSQLDF